MGVEGDFEQVAGAATAFEAALIVGRLAAVGIQAMDDGLLPIDEFTMAKQLQGRKHIRIFVHQDEAAAARETLAMPVDEAEVEAQAEAAADEEPEPDDGPGAPLDLNWWARLRALLDIFR